MQPPPDMGPLPPLPPPPPRVEQATRLVGSSPAQAAPVASTEANGDRLPATATGTAVAEPVPGAPVSQPIQPEATGTPPASTVTPVAAAPATSAPQLSSAAAPVPDRPEASRSPGWLLLPALAMVLWAWWLSIRRNRRLAEEAAWLSRQQRALQSAHRHLKEKSRHLRELSTQDPLTGVLNRLAFATELRERLEHLARYGQPLNLIVFDLDHFKAINDRFGHTAGDRALMLVVGIVREHLVSDDLFGRFGGDEFMIACSGQPLATGQALADAIRAAVAERAPQADPPLPGLSLSMGVAQANGEHGYGAQHLFEQADAALYEAKQRGRNTVVVAQTTMESAPGATLRHL